MEALFSSLAGGAALRAQLLHTIAEAASWPAARRIDLHVMTFAFTDADVAEALVEAAARNPSMTVRILGDWRTRTQQVGRLAKMQLPNVIIRYNYDQPYVWDNGRLRWSYHASRGLLHHKTLAVLVDDRPVRLICGSFNWTATAARSYENVLILNADTESDAELMTRMELEFEALWFDEGASLTPEEAQVHYDAILDSFRADPTVAPADVVGLSQGRSAPSAVGRRDVAPVDGKALDRNVVIAFSSRGADPTLRRGAAESNREQRFELRTATGALKPMPLGLTHLTLDSIFRAAPGDTLKVAMYGLSPRVPEYSALLDAARRGVRLRILLDRSVGSETAGRLARVQARDGLPIEIRSSGRMMHNKYIVHVEQATVVTGTANLSTDATSRHYEHRIRIRSDRKLTDRFEADFETMWSRLRGLDEPTSSSAGQKKKRESR